MCTYTKLLTPQPKCFHGKLEKQWILWLRSFRFLKYGSEKGTVFTPRGHSVLNYCQVLFCMYSLRALSLGSEQSGKRRVQCWCLFPRHKLHSAATAQLQRSQDHWQQEAGTVCDSTLTTLPEWQQLFLAAASDSWCPSWFPAQSKESSANPYTKFNWGSSEMLI